MARLRRGSQGVSLPDLVPGKGLLVEDQTRVRDALQHTIALGTRELYRKHFGYFEQWCGPRSIDPMSASAAHVSAYLAYMGMEKKAMSTIRCASAAIGKTYEWAGRTSPVACLDVRELLRGLGLLLPSAHRPPG